MKFHPLYLPLAPFLLLIVTTLAHAARPLTADDSSILDANTCQLEAWGQRANNQTEYWTVPACNFNIGWELAAGLAQARSEDGRAVTRLGVLQAKTAIRKLAPNDWGLGLVLARQPAAAGSLKGDTSINVPVTISLSDEKVLVHANIGWVRQGATPGDCFTWAIGTEFGVSQRTVFTLESFGSQLGRSRIQTGIRYSVLPSYLDLDASYGERLTARGQERVVSIGLTLMSSL